MIKAEHGSSLDVTKYTPQFASEGKLLISSKIILKNTDCVVQQE